MKEQEKVARLTMISFRSVIRRAGRIIRICSRLCSDFTSDE